MNCERYRNELEDFIYGELTERRAAEIRAHLAACPACAALRHQLERENEIFAQFYEQTAIDPTTEMWAEIRARIGAEGQSRSRLENGAGRLRRLREGAFGWLLAPAMLRQAAFAILLIALSVAATTIYLRRGEREGKDVAKRNPEATPTPSPQQTVTPAPAPSPSTYVAGVSQNTVENPPPKSGPAPAQRVRPQLSDQELMNQQIARAEREYQKAVRMLDQAIAKRRGSLDPALVKEYQSSLALIDSSIASSRRALLERPGDPTAGQFLLAAYARKVELMQDIAMK